MCGICGYLGIEEDGLLEKMTSVLTHRGPDGEGYFQEGPVGLGHRRLSIIDVAGGQQPIFNEDKSLVLVCNGEIYNYKELRQDLLAKGHRFKTHSDSEVILHLYEEEGINSLNKLIGMFAFAIFDRQKKQLFIARDRLGVKPLYYSFAGGQFLFSSEMKSLLQSLSLSPALDHQAVLEYLRLRYVPSPAGMFLGIKKFPPGSWGLVQNGNVSLQRYWEPELYSGPYSGSARDYQEEFEHLFRQSIRRRLISDVSLGAYLSGGLDSSIIAGTMSQMLSKPVQTFSVGFDFEHDELLHASSTAKTLGCDHTEIACRPEDMALLPQAVYHLDEPIGDAIVVPMFMLSREAKKQVTVILSGEGADEVFGGYLFHKALLYGHYLQRGMPERIRQLALLPAVRSVPSRVLNAAFQYPADLGDRGKRKLVDFLELLQPTQLPAAYRHLISLFDHYELGPLLQESYAKASSDYSSREYSRVSEIGAVPFLNSIIDLQFSHWLPDDILMKQDKMSMAHGIEARVPFLDHELVEFALRLPPSMKIHWGTTKAILRNYASKILPTTTAKRKKMPFYVPVEKYTSHRVFQELLHDTLGETAVKNRGLLQPKAVSRLVNSLRSGEFLYVKQAISLIILELWFRVMVDRRGVV